MFITRRACVNSNSKYTYICTRGAGSCFVMKGYEPPTCEYVQQCILCLYNPKLIVSEHDDDDYDIISFIYNTICISFSVFVVIFSSGETINI